MMRDPGRIPQMMHQLKALWVQNPDMRLGQLLGNVLSEIDPDRESVARNLFLLEDGALLKLMEEWNDGRS